MKTFEIIAQAVLVILIIAALFLIIYISYDTGRIEGRYEQGKWIYVKDTTSHYEFKPNK